MGRFIDLTGKKFGRLTVIKRSEDYTRKEAEEKYFGEFTISVNERVVKGEV